MEKNKTIKIGLGVIGSIFILLFLSSIFVSVNMGETMVYQNKVSGESRVYHGPDFVIKPPFISSTTFYKKDTTLSFANKEAGENFTSMSDPIVVAFADTYKAKVIINARLQLPSSDEQMLKLHEAFRSQDNLVRSLYTKTMVDVVTNTAT